VPVLRIGVTDSAAELNIQDIALWQLNDVREQWAATLPELFG
jgi:hypothetical protein